MIAQLGRLELGNAELGSSFGGFDFTATLDISCSLASPAFTPPLVGTISKIITLDASSNVGLFKGDSLLGRATLGSLQLGATLTNVLTPETPLNIYLNLTAELPTSVIYGLLEI